MSGTMSETRNPNTDPQPLPVKGDIAVHEAVISAISARRDLGIRKYGRALETGNGRNALRDAFEESLDLSCYLAQALLESGEEL